MSLQGINKESALKIVNRLVLEKISFEVQSIFKFGGRFGDYSRLSIVWTEEGREKEVQVDGRCKATLQKFMVQLLGLEWFGMDKNKTYYWEAPAVEEEEEEEEVVAVEEVQIKEEISIKGEKMNSYIVKMALIELLKKLDNQKKEYLEKSPNSDSYYIQDPDFDFIQDHIIATIDQLDKISSNWREELN